ncbi:MAG: NAD-dependent epimerase/dehydratase family protein [Planctomycetota bacterium]
MTDAATLSQDRPTEATPAALEQRAPPPPGGPRRRDVALLGAGYIAEFHAAGVARADGWKLRAVCDRDLERARALAARFGAPEVYGDLAEMLEKAQPSVVHNLLPPEAHFATTKAILEGGAGCYLEKPFCLDADRCAELVELADTHGQPLGVSHNFLFSPVYQRLQQDVRAGRLGRIEHVHLVWHKPLPQLQDGGTGAWMFQAPGNILTEVGPHPLAHLLDLLGDPTELRVVPAAPQDLTRGRRFYRRWRLQGEAGEAAFDITMSFAPGHTEHSIHARGTLASATVDFERNTYVRHRHRPYQFDLERWATTLAESASLAAQGTATLGKLLLSRAKLSRFGSPFGDSIGRAIAAFYGQLDQQVPTGLGGDFATRVIALAERAAADLPTGEAIAAATPPPATTAPTTAVDTLVIGGTGFIGRRLVRALTEAGRGVRVLGRSEAKLALLDGLPIETQRGGLDAASLTEALQGVKTVYHLAKGAGNQWEDWVRTDVEPTRRLAEACLDAGVERLVYTSSIALYHAGRSAEVITEGTAADPDVINSSLYARAKQECEKTLLELHKTRGLPVVIARPGIVVGEGGPPQHGGLAQWPGPSLCVIPGSGQHRLPFVLVDDVADALARCATAADVEGHTFNLVGDVRLTAAEYVDALERRAAVRFDRFTTPVWRLWLAELGKWLVKVAVRHHNRRFPAYGSIAATTFAAQFDNSAAKRGLGWQPEVDRGRFLDAALDEPVRAHLRGGATGRPGVFGP